MDIMYDDTPLRNELTLLDVGFIYAWRRIHPMRLFYRVREPEKESDKHELAVVADEPIASAVASPKEVVVEKTEVMIDESKQGNLETSNADENTKAVAAHEISTSCEPAKKELPFNENVNEMSMDTSQMNTTANNTENLTITAMVASIESASRQVLETSKPDESNVVSNQRDSTGNFKESQQSLSKKIETVTADIEMETQTNRSEVESHSDKENNVVNDNLVVSVSGKKNAGMESTGKVLDVSCQLLKDAPNAEAVLNPSSISAADVVVSQATEVNASSAKLLDVTLQEGSICKAKSKKNPRRKTMDAPGSAGGVAKKKKDALTPQNTNDNINSHNTSNPIVQQAKKVFLKFLEYFHSSLY